MPAIRNEQRLVNPGPCPRCGKTEFHLIHQDGTALPQRLTYACCDSCGEMWLYVEAAESA